MHAYSTQLKQSRSSDWRGKFVFKKERETWDPVEKRRVILERAFAIKEEFVSAILIGRKDLPRWTGKARENIHEHWHWLEGHKVNPQPVSMIKSDSLDHGETNTMEIRRGSHQWCCIPSSFFNLHSKWLAKKALEGIGDFKTEDMVNETIKYAASWVLLANKVDAPYICLSGTRKKLLNENKLRQVRSNENIKIRLG